MTVHNQTVVDHVSKARSTVRFWRRGWRYLRRLLLVLPLLLLLVAVILYLTAQHIPTWYRPAPLNPEDYRRVRADATNFVDSVGDRLVMQEVFELELSDHALNEWLTALPELWPDVKEDWPRQLSAPALKFAPDAVHLGALYEDERWKGIVNASFTCAVSADKQELTFRLLAARAGSLPVPEVVLNELLAPLRAELQESGVNPAHRARIQLDSAEELYRGVTIPNHFVWPNGKRPFRFESIKIKDGSIHLRVVPL